MQGSDYANNMYDMNTSSSGITCKTTNIMMTILFLSPKIRYSHPSAVVTVRIIIQVLNNTNKCVTRIISSTPSLAEASVPFESNISNNTIKAVKTNIDQQIIIGMPANTIDRLTI